MMYCQRYSGILLISIGWSVVCLCGDAEESLSLLVYGYIWVNEWRCSGFRILVDVDLRDITYDVLWKMSRLSCGDWIATHPINDENVGQYIV